MSTQCSPEEVDWLLLLLPDGDQTFKDMSHQLLGLVVGRFGLICEISKLPKKNSAARLVKASS